MKKITLFLLLISTSVFSQTFNDNNTLIILYEEELKHISPHSYFYHIPLRDNNKKDPFDNENKVTFVYNVFKDFDHADRKDSTVVLKINKSFLRKNKEIIFTKDDFNKMDRLQLFLKLDKNRSKNIFLIDKNEIKNGKLLLREVSFFYIHEE